MLGCCERRWWCSTFEKYYYNMGCGVGQKRGNRRLHSVSKVVWIINILNLPPFSNKELQNLKNIIKYLAKINKQKPFQSHNLSIAAFGVVQLLRTLYVLHKSRFDFMLGLMKSTRDKSHISTRVSHPTIVFVVHIVTLLNNILREIIFAIIHFSFITTQW